MLSYSSGHQEGMKWISKKSNWNSEKRPDLKIEGPIQYDAAVDMEIGQSKMPNSEVAGQAVCLFSLI
jgi:phosphate acetyltransferase